MKLTYIYMITSSSVKMVPFFELQGIILQYYLLEKVLWFACCILYPLIRTFRMLFYPIVLCVWKLLLTSMYGICLFSGEGVSPICQQYSILAL